MIFFDKWNFIADSDYYGIKATLKHVPSSIRTDTNWSLLNGPGKFAWNTKPSREELRLIIWRETQKGRWRVCPSLPETDWESSFILFLGIVKIPEILQISWVVKLKNYLFYSLWVFHLTKSSQVLEKLISP